MSDGDDELVSFLVMATSSAARAGQICYGRPAFVRAKDPGDAVTKAIAKLRLNMFASVTFEVYVIGADELKDVMPELKQIARAYWREAFEGDFGLSEFERAWEEHGATLDDGEDF